MPIQILFLLVFYNLKNIPLFKIGGIIWSKHVIFNTGGHPCMLCVPTPLKREETLRDVPGLPSENNKFARFFLLVGHRQDLKNCKTTPILVCMGDTSGLTPSQTRESIPGRPPETHNWQTGRLSLSHSILILIPISPGCHDVAAVLTDAPVFWQYQLQKRVLSVHSLKRTAEHLVGVPADDKSGAKTDESSNPQKL